MKIFRNKVTVVTGVGSGIGRELALQLAREKAQLALCDIDKEKLSETVKLCDQYSPKVFSKVFDVSKIEEFESFHSDVIGEFGHVDLMINNAGIALGGYTVEETSMHDFERIMGVNFWGMVYGTKLFLADLKAREESALVNVSSLFGLAGIAQNGAYCATKFGIRGFTEALRMEAHIDFPHVKIHTVHPGGIDTNIVKEAKWNKALTDQEISDGITEFEKNFITSAADAAKTILKAIRNKKSRILIGKDARSLDRIVRLMPEGYTNMVIKKLVKD